MFFFNFLVHISFDTTFKFYIFLAFSYPSISPASNALSLLLYRLRLLRKLILLTFLICLIIFQIYIISRSSKILTELKFWLGIHPWKNLINFGSLKLRKNVLLCSHWEKSLFIINKYFVEYGEMNVWLLLTNFN